MQRLLTTLLVLTASLISAQAARADSRTGCADVPASAVDQYCEMLPTATGGHAPSSSDTKLGGTLPLGLVRATLRSPLGRRLGGLPGRDPESASQAVIPVAGGRVSPWSLSMPLILVLAGLAAVLTVIAAERWRRTRRGAP